jgi:hypothetical protein
LIKFFLIIAYVIYICNQHQYLIGSVFLCHYNSVPGHSLAVILTSAFYVAAFRSAHSLYSVCLSFFLFLFVSFNSKALS